MITRYKTIAPLVHPHNNTLKLVPMKWVRTLDYFTDKTKDIVLPMFEEATIIDGKRINDVSPLWTSPLIAEKVKYAVQL